MGWIGYALLATLVMTGVNFGDKYVVERHVPDPRATMIFFSIVNVIMGALLWFVSGRVFLPPDDAFLLLLSGATVILGGYFYFQAITRTEISRVIVMIQLTPVFTLLLSVIFLGGRLTLPQLLGFALILLAAVAITRGRKSVTRSADAVGRDILLRMVAATLLWSVGAVLIDQLIEKLVVDQRTLLVTLSYSSLGYFLGGVGLLLTMPQVRRSFASAARTVRPLGLLSLFLVESGFVLRQLLLYTAFSLGDVALVTVVGSVNVFIGILLGWGLTLLWPLIFKEDISRANLLHKSTWAAVAFVGLLLVR